MTERCRQRSHIVSSGVLIAAVTTLAIIASGCGENASGSGALVTDSAGVTIVENLPPSRERAASWQIVETPEVEIGAREGSEAEMLTGVFAATTLSDGRIVLLDANPPHVRVFDATGDALATGVPSGEGPGEARSPSGMFVMPGDSLLLYDGALWRVSVLTGSLEFARSFALRPEPGSGRTFLAGRFPDGSLVGWRGFSSGQGQFQGTGVYRATTRFTRFGHDGDLVADMGEFLDSEIAQLFTETRRTYTSPAFPKGRAQAVHGNYLIIAYTERYELRYHDADGRLRRVVRLPIDPMPVTDEEEESYRESRLAGVADNPDAAARVRELIEAFPFPTHHPLVDAMRADPLGNVWVKRNQREPESEVPPTWDVFDPDGNWKTEIRMPAALSVIDIGEDYLLGVWRDDFRVPYLRLHRLVKN